MLRDRWRVYLGIALVYIILLLIFVKGFASTLDIEETKGILEKFYFGFSGKALTAAAVFGSLIGSSMGAEGSVGASTYQTFIVILIILASIWAVRQQHTGAKFKVRDAFYRGMYPLVPFILVSMVIGLQMIPLGIGGWLYTATITTGLAVTVIEKALWIILVALLVLLSLYMVTSSVFALYIVTLPDMTPMRALRSARKLTLHRRWAIVSRIVFITLVLVILAMIIMAPFILWLPQIAEWVFFSISVFGLLIPVIFLYNLYRELLNE